MQNQQVGFVTEDREHRRGFLVDRLVALEVVDALANRALSLCVGGFAPRVPINRPKIVQHVPAFLCLWSFGHS